MIKILRFVLTVVANDRGNEGRRAAGRDQGMAVDGGVGRLFVFVAMVAFLPGAVMGFVWSAERITGRADLLWPLIAGFAVGVALDECLLRRIPGAETFEHELSHALVALLFLRKVERFVVTGRRGGWVRHSGGFGGVLADDFIGLAPYILPTFTALSVAVRPLLDARWFPWFDLWIGTTLGYHTWSTIRETREAWTSRRFVSAGTGEAVQSDIARRGFLYSAVCIATATLAIHGVLLAVIVSGYGATRLWWHVVWKETTAVWSAAVAAAGRLLRRFS